MPPRRRKALQPGLFDPSPADPKRPSRGSSSGSGELESEIQSRIRKVLEANGFTVLRINGGAAKIRGSYVRFYILYGLNRSDGFPDLLAMKGDGEFAYTALIEVKRKGEEPSPEQIDVHTFLRGRGIPVYVMDDYSQAQQLANSYRERQRARAAQLPHEPQQP